MDITELSSSLWRTLGLQNKQTLYLALSIPLLAITTATALRTLSSSSPNPHPSQPPSILRAPDPSTQKEDPDDLPYPPNALPGARDVPTPYGSIRVYEFGPENGRKVLFIHGISTPCIAFAGMSRLLVEERGCRVMLFDLFGRGYSDTPDPQFHRQDMALWTSQILLCLSSSPLAWCGGGERFTLVGYSLGGGIATSFVSWFPELVEGLVLVAPGGLLRRERVAASSKLLYGNLLPDWLVRWAVGRRLKGSASPPGIGRKREKGAEENDTTGVGDAAEAEIPGHPANAADSTALIFPDRPKVSIANAVAWQVDAHPGFLKSFISSIKYAPVSFEHERWRIVGRRCSARRAAAAAADPFDDETLPGLEQNQVLIIFGAQDEVIIAEETGEDATAVLGRENVKIVKLKGGHDVPVVNSIGCVDAILDFWDDSPV